MNNTLIIANKHSAKSHTTWSWIASKAIQLYTGSKYYHTEIIFDGHWYTADIASNMVIKRKLKPFKDNYDYIKIDIDYDITKSTLNKLLAKKYDLEAIIFNHILRLDINDKDKMYCTELALRILHANNIAEEIKDNGRVTPGGFVKRLKQKYDIIYGSEHTNLLYLFSSLI